MKALNAAVGLAAGLSVLSSLALAAPLSAEAGWRAIQRCAAFANDRERHSCMDAVLKDAGIFPTPEARAVERRKSFGLPQSLEAPKVKQPAAPFAPAPSAPLMRSSTANAPPPAPAAQQVAPSSEPPENPNRVVVTLARVVEGGDRKLVVTTSDGAVWRQLESGAVRPMPHKGQTMVIETTMFGGFMCEPTQYSAFRCYRVR